MVNPEVRGKRLLVRSDPISKLTIDLLQRIAIDIISTKTKKYTRVVASISSGVCFKALHILKNTGRFITHFQAVELPDLPQESTLLSSWHSTLAVESSDIFLRSERLHFSVLPARICKSTVSVVSVIDTTANTVDSSCALYCIRPSARYANASSFHSMFTAAVTADRL